MKLSLFLMHFFALSSFATDLNEIQSKFNEIAMKSSSAVVYVKVEKEAEARVLEPEFFFGYVIPDEKVYKYKIGGAGSGVLIDERGYIVTNYHVVEESESIKVKVRDRRGEKMYSAYYVGGDKTLDIAIIKIKSSEKFPYIKFSDKKSQVGDIVFAIGYPFGYSQTFTQGVVSGLGASLRVEGRAYRDLIQTDAAINQGNSGGPLINIDGEIAGINTAIMSPTGVFVGLGFAIPVKQVREVFEEVVLGKRRESAWLGVSLLHVKALISKGYNIPEGGIINMIFDGSPAEKAGLRRGDVIVSADGNDVKDDEDLYATIYRKKPGEKIVLEYVRNGVKKSVSVLLALKPKEHTSGKITAQKYNLENSFSWENTYFKESEDGIYVLSVSDKSSLNGYLKVGDIIKGINGVQVSSLRELENALSSSSLKDGVLFDIEREGEPFYLSVQVK